MFRKTFRRAVLILLFTLAGPPVGFNQSAETRQARVIPIRPMFQDVEVLYGDPEVAGEPFVIRIRELAGTTVPPHSHPVDEHITVVQGTWYFGIGEKYDRSALKEMKTGSYGFAPRGATMFAYSPEPAIVQVHGIGPFHIHWRHGYKSLDDADAEGTFKFKKGERVTAKRGSGRIYKGHASGEIIQYEIEGEDGSLFMADEAELRRIGNER